MCDWICIATLSNHTLTRVQSRGVLEANKSTLFHSAMPHYFVSRVLQALR